MNIKNNQKGFSVQGIIIVIALIIIAVLAYYMGTKNVVAPKGDDVVVNATTTVADAKCANGATNYPHCNADLLNISELKSLNGITNSGASFTIKYPKSYVFIEYSCNISGIAFWPESLPRVIPTGNACPQAMINSAPIIVTTETKPQLIVVDPNYKEDAKNFTITISTVQQPSFTVLSPNGNENWVKGSTKTIRWSNPSTETVSGAGGPQDEISIFINSQPTDTAPLLKTIVTGLNKNTTSYVWNVGSNAENSVLNGSYYIKVCRQSFRCDWSDAPFTITN